jgi:hypothetical protein
MIFLSTLGQSSTHVVYVTSQLPKITVQFIGTFDMTSDLLSAAYSVAEI